ncbi:hypothetical protein [Lactobacillus apis]|uniref:hypothetical protein n=1 Tax=Lactobacillus apis TaxID=303541 RepID=UPI002432C3C9|nr:hypothetical protein [Lactobacillus apis]
MLHKHPKTTPLSAKDYADAINFMHPFREGNGRSCKIFLSAYAANHGQMIDYPKKNEEMIQAQNEANIDQIAKLIKVENTPSRNRTLQLLASQQKNAQKQINQSRLPKNSGQQEIDCDDNPDL